MAGSITGAGHIGEAATANHYEILGVAPDASHDVAKRAYLDQALRFHPDRQQGGSETARASAAFRMTEVNEAWAVLRNPGTRAHYDDQLASARTAATTTTPSPGPTSARTAGSPASRVGASASGVRSDDLRREPQVADLARDDARRAAGPASSRLRTLAPMLIGAAVLAGIMIFASYAQTDEPGVGVRTVERYAVGTCVVVGFGPALANPVPGEQAREAVVAVPCDQVGSRQIVSRVPLPRPCPVGTRAQLLPGTDDALCLR